MNQFNICFNCEYALSEPLKFCPNCGAQLNWQLSTPFATDNQNAPHQTMSNSVESSSQSNVQNEHIHPTETSSHSNTNNTEAPTELKSNSYAEPTVEIRLKRPFMIGVLSVKGVFDTLLGIFFFIAGLRGIFLFNIITVLVGLIMLGASYYYFKPEQILSVKKPCPYCSEKNLYLISHTPHQCTFCQRKINIKWE